MEIITGSFYFISDAFFNKVNDPFLKTNYETTKRPHHFAIKDKYTNLLWLVPCSTRIEKFEKIIETRKRYNRPNDTIKIVNVQGTKTALLLQDMFPADEKYISNQYIRGGKAVKIINQNIISDIERSARRVIMLLRNGVKFTPTQPDAIRIERIMLDELSEKQQD